MEVGLEASVVIGCSMSGQVSISRRIRTHNKATSQFFARTRVNGPHLVDKRGNCLSSAPKGVEGRKAFVDDSLAPDQQATAGTRWVIKRFWKSEADLHQIRRNQEGS
ncbi:hypothetical protein ANO11243_079320 [Dothideomycetidae sp. 11243]|nr:hypothetical protein ANO11243_079320 [fungal sp. No.11243]